MGLVKRIRDITLATLNDKLEKAEDPVRLIDQFLWTTRDEIIQVEKLHQQYSMHVHQLRTQWLSAEEQIEKKENQALIALKAGEEQIARNILTEKTMLSESAASYRELYNQAAQSLQEVEEQLNILRQEYQTVYDKRQFYVAKMETIRLQRRMNERLGFQSQESSNEMMRKMENRLSDMELENQALRQVRSGNSNYHNQSSFTQQKSWEVEQQLQQLKDKLNKEGWSD